MKGFIVLFFLFLCATNPAFAQSNYVLPYPSAMPGSKFYIIERVYEKVSQYWYFGSFAQFNYNVKYSNKYLVEAKTLFDYHQYLLALDALERSNEYFRKIEYSLQKAQKENKNVTEKKTLLEEISEKHKEELTKLLLMTPAEFQWSTEQQSEKLLIHSKINHSVKVRDL